ncbi:hypothetical protein QBC37DRAFT_405618 [Rhypophila decipiens]|uniref:Uncharacterized protein n=1 Tax=Rhypophila decipiens TaxID=261697 RepID=A0AAN7B308_9PEZI|nr:hypothetical protein QBC37DRAFT_405618 [Rhypophila decipiens]
MRSSWMALILGATALVQSTPTNVPLPSLVPRGYHPYGPVRWTLHDSCGMPLLPILGVAMASRAKERSKLSVPILETWVTECVKYPKCSLYREQCELLFGPFGRSYDSVKNFERRCNQTIEHMKHAADIQGPISGRRPDQPEESKLYTNSDEWKGLEKLSKHYMNFCAPDLGSSSTGSDDSMHDKALDEDIGLDTPLGRMYQDVKENAAHNDSYHSSRYTAPQLVTRQHKRPKYFSWGIFGSQAWAQRFRIAATITFHPVWPNTLAEKEKGLESAILHNGDYFAPDLRELPCKEEEPVPIERLERVSGLFHSELFRLNGLGRLGDDNGTRSYGWAGVRESGNHELPEFYMYLGLQMELWSRNLTLNYDGTVGELQE